MKKYLVIASLVLFLIVVMGVVLYWWIYQPVINLGDDELSDQSLDRFEQMKSSGEYGGRLQTLENPAGEVFRTDCFSFSMPLSFSSVRQEEGTGTCLLRASLYDPDGVLIVHADHLPELVSLDEHSGIILREQSEDYQPVDFVSTLGEVRAYQANSELTIFIFQPPVLTVVAFSDLHRVDAEIKSAAQQLLDSLQTEPVEQWRNQLR